MRRRGTIKVSEFGKLYAGYIARLKKLGAEYCQPCHAYLAVTHDCHAFRPLYLPMPLEAYRFAAEPRGG